MGEAARCVNRPGAPQEARPSVKGETANPTGGRFRGCILPLDALVFALPAERRRVGPSRRDAYHEPRRRKLSPEQAAAIRASAGNRSLRELAAEFGVSHETVRSVIQGAGTISVRVEEPGGATLKRREG